MKNLKFKWLLLSIILSIASINQMWADKTLYVETTAFTGYSNPRVHYWGGAGVSDSKIEPTYTYSNCFYVFTIPDNAQNWQVCRYDNGGYYNYHGGDGKSTSDYNFCYITGWDNGSESWGSTTAKTYDGSTYVYWRTNPANYTAWGDNATQQIRLIRVDGGTNLGFVNATDADRTTDHVARYLVPAGTYVRPELHTGQNNAYTKTFDFSSTTSDNFIYNFTSNGGWANWGTSYFSRGAYVYFDNSNSTLNHYYKYILIGRSGTSNAYAMSHIDHTDLWCYTSGLTYNDFTEFYIISDDDTWGQENNSASTRIGGGNADEYSVSTPKLMDHADRLCNLFVPDNETHPNLTHTASGNNATLLNFTHTIKYSVDKVGDGAHYAELTTGRVPADITVYSVYKFVNGTYGSVSASSLSQTLEQDGSHYSATIDAARTSEVSVQKKIGGSVGYDFIGWYDHATSTDNLHKLSASLILDNYKPTGNSTIYARFKAKQVTVTLDQQTSATGYSASGSVSNPTATYDASLPALSGTLPTAANGYSFDGFYTNINGRGVKLIDANGFWVNSATGYITDGKWTRATTLTIYAYYKPATVSFAFDATKVAAEANVLVTPTWESIPVGTEGTNYKVCYSVQYYDGTALESQPTLYNNSTDAEITGGNIGTKIRFAAPSTPGTYRFAAKVYAGSSCGGTLIKQSSATFEVAGPHKVYVMYKCGDTYIHSTNTVDVDALGNVNIAPEDILGYTFTDWTVGYGLVNNSGSTTANPINISADYDGFLTANYSKNTMIYFKNTLGWSNVYVNFIGASYWDTSKGTGNKDKSNRNLQMTQIGSSDVYYYDCTAASITPNNYVSFTNQTFTDGANGAEFFWKANGDALPAEVVYPTAPAAKTGETNAESAAYYGYNSGTPMFVPLNKETQAGAKRNDDGKGYATYYNKGYWRDYNPHTGKTGYRLEIYNQTGSEGRELLYTRDFQESLLGGDTIFEATVNLQSAAMAGESAYGVKFLRNTDYGYTNISGRLHPTGNAVAFTKQDASNWAACYMKPIEAGDYTIRLICDHSTGELKLAAKYPISAGDYKLRYKDGTQTKWLTSSVIEGKNGTAKVSFFLRNSGSGQNLNILKSTLDLSKPDTPDLKWADYGDANRWSEISASVTEDGVYTLNLAIDANGDLTITSIEPYTGEYYIRTDCAPGNWEHYKYGSNNMTYSDYSAEHENYSHYYVKFVNQNTNIKFCIANDYSPNVSDTLIGDATYKGVTINGSGKMTAPSSGVNIRFMWNQADNSIGREYITGPVTNDYLSIRTLTSEGKIFSDRSGTRLPSASVTESGNSYTVDSLRFVDNTNWIYELDVYAQPGATFKVVANVNGTYNFFYGQSGAYNVAANVDTLIGGTGDAKYHISILYDFKTNRLMKAWIPEGEVSTDLNINADIMMVREGQEDAQQITFGKKGGSEDYGSLGKVKTVYGVMQFNKYTLNNRSKESGHDYLYPSLSPYERAMYWISFPFDVNLSDVFGFGEYGKHWIMEYYDGKGRAKNGFWVDSEANWKFITPEMKDTFKLEKYTGYVLALDLDSFDLSNTRTWANGAEYRELYFPSTGFVGTINHTAITVDIDTVGYQCNIDRRINKDIPNIYLDRRIVDSHWHCIGTPNYQNNDHDVTSSAYTTLEALKASNALPYVYRYNSTDNSISAVSSGTFTFKPMHSYLVQYALPTLSWAAASRPASVVAKTHNRADYNLQLELWKDEALNDQALMRLTDDENVTNAFEFNYDLCKETNSDKANIWTMTADSIPVAGNSMRYSKQTTIVSVGVKIVASGEYTFAIPEGTEGVGVVLVDNVANTRTNLGLVNYTIYLETGQIDGRFSLEIAPISEILTGIDNSVTDSRDGVSKKLIDGVLYIVKDGEVFDARGNKVK